MNVQAIRELIKQAEEHELRTGHLTNALSHKITSIHRAIELPANSSVTALFAFVLEYIGRVPDFIAAIREAATQAHIEEYVLPIVEQAERYFLAPPELVKGRVGLEELLAETYLAYRLIEEVNDRYISHAGIPLIPLDMTATNLIAHTLIGEPFANQLDIIVHDVVARMLSDELPVNKQTTHSHAVEQQSYTNHPFCLSHTSGVNLSFYNTTEHVN